MQSQRTPQTDQRFHDLYTELASAWEAREDLRTQNVPIASLSQTAFRLYDARGAMWDWWHPHGQESTR